MEIERSYRIVGAIQTIAGDIENHVVPLIKEAMTSWLKMVFMLYAIALGVFVTILLVLGQWFDSLSLFSYDFTDASILSSIKLGLTIFGFAVIHFSHVLFRQKSWLINL